MEEPPIPVPAPLSMRRAVFAATLGNALEFYDFVTFAYFAIQIGKTFFPSHDPFVSLMGSLATFGVGFVTRPIGAYVLGGYADRHGRKRAMLLSMMMMGAGIALLVLTPGYARIGVLAPIAAVTARLLQGLALGGEVGSATIYMMEASDPYKRGFTISWQGASQGISATVGALVGLLISLVLTGPELTSYGWRIALGLGLFIVPVALMVRSSLPETLDLPEEVDSTVVAADGYARIVVLGILIIGTGTIATYIFHYMATFGQNTLHLSTAVSMAGEFANNGIGILLALWAGALSDRHGRRPLMIWPQLLFVLGIVPSFLWVTTSRTAFAFIGGNVVLSILTGFQYSAVYAAISESLPRLVRARAFALVYSIPVALFGGTTQLVITWLLKVTGEPMAIAWYLTAVSVLGLIGMILMRESAPARLARS